MFMSHSVSFSYILHLSFSLVHKLGCFGSKVGTWTQSNSERKKEKKKKRKKTSAPRNPIINAVIYPESYILVTETENMNKGGDLVRWKEEKKWNL